MEINSHYEYARLEEFSEKSRKKKWKTHRPRVSTKGTPVKRLAYEDGVAADIREPFLPSIPILFLLAFLLIVSQTKSVLSAANLRKISIALAACTHVTVAAPPVIYNIFGCIVIVCELKIQSILAVQKINDF